MLRTSREHQNFSLQFNDKSPMKLDKTATHLQRASAILFGEYETKVESKHRENKSKLRCLSPTDRRTNEVFYLISLKSIYAFLFCVRFVFSSNFWGSNDNFMGVFT